jgi:hypothetical protein
VWVKALYGDLECSYNSQGIDDRLYNGVWCDMIINHIWLVGLILSEYFVLLVVDRLNCDMIISHIDIELVHGVMVLLVAGIV